MKTIGNESANPVIENDNRGYPYYEHLGLTKREYFAAMSLSLFHGHSYNGHSEEQCKNIVPIERYRPFEQYKETLKRLLNSLQVYNTKPDECLNAFCYNGKIDMGYNECTTCSICEEIEERTGNWILLERINN